VHRSTTRTKALDPFISATRKYIKTKKTAERDIFKNHHVINPLKWFSIAGEFLDKAIEGYEAL